MRQYFILITLIFPLIAGSSGCIGAWIANGKAIEFDPNTTPLTVRHEFGKPIGIKEFRPRVSLTEAGFSFPDTVGGYPKDKSIVNQEQTVATVKRYQYVGAVRNRYYTDDYAFEWGFAKLTLGLSELYFIPWGICERIQKSTDITEFLVAFDENGYCLAERTALYNDHGRQDKRRARNRK